jgi:hypothetical protein
MRQSILRALELRAVAAGIASIVDLQWWSAAVTFPALAVAVLAADAQRT